MDKKLNLEQFILKSKAKHGDKYDYSKTVFTTTKHKVTITCPIHGDFEQLASNHLRGRGCKDCANLSISINVEGLLERMRSKHSGIYQYNLTGYDNHTSSKILIFCSIHGWFKQTANGHLSGKGCRKCNVRKPDVNALEGFIKRANEVHDNKFIYDKSVYVNSRAKLIIECPVHGEFLQSPSKHLSGQGCRKCSGNDQKNIEDFIARSVIIHGEKYDYSKSVYLSNKNKLVITCPIHGDFEQLPQTHLKGSGCRKCGYTIIGDKSRGSSNGSWNPNREEVLLKNRMRTACKNLLRRCLHDIGGTKDNRTYEMLGYTTDQLKSHIVSHPNWSSVKNTKWHIDHIFPIKAFIEHKVFDLKIINSLDNLQPLPEKRNLSKQGSYNKNLFIGYLKSRCTLSPAVSDCR